MPVTDNTRKPLSSRVLPLMMQGEVLALIAFSIVALGFYVWFLNHQEARAERYFTHLRVSNPAKYLNEVKQVSGYKDFLSAYPQIKGYTQFKPETPEFLLGRWSITPTAKRVSDSYESVNCVNPLLIENGRITYPGDKQARENVAFRLVGPTVILRRPGQPEKSIKVVASGVLLHHLEMVLPGDNKISYGYRCK